MKPARVRDLSPTPILAWFGVAVLLVLAPPKTLAAQDSSAGRVSDGLIVFYDFADENGEIIKDRSGVKPSLDLRIKNAAAVSRKSGKLEIRGPASIRSDKPATKVTANLKRSGEMTVEAWIRPAKTSQSGPARIVTISKNTVLRNFTLGQENATYDARLRASSSDNNGLPSIAAQGLKTAWTHVVYTRRRDGRTAMFVNGRQVSDGRTSGNLNNWVDSYPIALADEISQGRLWLGTYELVAIYRRALSAAEVKQNFDAGGQSIQTPPADVPQPKSAAHGARVRQGIELLYNFDEVDGDLVKDVSGTGPPVHLKIEKPNAVQRSAGSLTMAGKTLIRSDKPPTRMIEAVRRTGELTIEAWITPADDRQAGPARIVTLSKDGSNRNMTLGQEGNLFDVRLRTTKMSVNGIPSTATAAGTVKTRLTHVVYTRDRGGAARIYINGKQTEQKSVGGTLANWDASYRLALANEFSGDRSWRGKYHLVAIYSRDLSASEVSQNFRAGPDSMTTEDLAVNRASVREHFFETKIAPLFSKHCLECHDTAAKEGGLDLSRRKDAFAGGDSGDAIVPGKPDGSLVWKSVVDDDMPHDRPPLSKQEKQLLRQWIEEDAAWSVDWIDPSIYKEERGTENWVRRLTIPEYIETVRSAVGVDIADEAKKILPPDKRADGFSNTAYNLGVDFEHVDAYARLAQAIVEKMDLPQFSSRFTKKKRLIDDDMRGLIKTMGKWVFRGPLDEREVVDFRGITTSVASAGGNFEEAVGLVLEAMLQSPRFIYRIENQRGDGTELPVNEYELASRMSYILWGAPPDESLMRAAEAGDLYDPAGVQEQVQRMLKDPRAVQRSEQFITQWLDLDRLSNLRPNEEKFPNWDAAIAADMRAETLAYFHEIVWKQKRPLADLLNAQVTFATPRLAKHYRMPPQGDAMARYDLRSVPSRGGLLTQGSLLTIGGDDASMVTRGLFVLNDLLFSEVGDPPPGLDTTPVPTSPGRSHRAIATERIESTSCGGCHSRFEPLAFGLEKFDGLGSFHDSDEYDNKLRDDGEILFPGNSEPVKYATAAELMDLLAESDRVAECLTRKVTQFALGRPLVASDAREVRKIHRQAQEKGGTYAGTVTAIVLSDLVQKTRTVNE